MHSTLILMNQSHQNANRRRLAGAVRANYAHDDARGQRQANVVESKVRVDLWSLLRNERRGYSCVLLRQSVRGFSHSGSKFFRRKAK
jgi:flagellin-like hook-associated protein FlgL